MRKQKPRNAFVTQDTNFTDLGVLNMTPIRAIEEDDDADTQPEAVRVEILEPKNWSTRNKVIVRNS